uniref:Uncharacterized protein n=1 Tax=Branchiostoma floridae TaxID=7739 RepID=C3XT05_BRAFL|eukprot:XP_002612729.1 hypothetical protein BRAFLDRAFT_97292 [Branchiostoma floridae]
MARSVTRFQNKEQCGIIYCQTVGDYKDIHYRLQKTGTESLESWSTWRRNRKSRSVLIQGIGYNLLGNASFSMSLHRRQACCPKLDKYLKFLLAPEVGDNYRQRGHTDTGLTDSGREVLQEARQVTQLKTRPAARLQLSVRFLFNKMRDKRGILRGACLKCSQCDEFQPDEGEKYACAYCGCSPVSHTRPASDSTSAPTPDASSSAESNSFHKAYFPTCLDDGIFKRAFGCERNRQFGRKEKVEKLTEAIDFVQSNNPAAAGRFLKDGFQVKGEQDRNIILWGIEKLKRVQEGSRQA